MKTRLIVEFSEPSIISKILQIKNIKYFFFKREEKTPNIN